MDLLQARPVHDTSRGQVLQADIQDRRQGIDLRRGEHTAVPDEGAMAHAGLVRVGCDQDQPGGLPGKQVPRNLTGPLGTLNDAVDEGIVQEDDLVPKIGLAQSADVVRGTNQLHRTFDDDRVSLRIVEGTVRIEPDCPRGVVAGCPQAIGGHL